MTLAATAATLAETSPAITFTGGYAVLPTGGRATFPPATVIRERRNSRGRVTNGLYEFPDGSRLHFHWHPDRGPTFRTYDHDA